LSRLRIRIWIGIKIESQILIRIFMKTMPIHNTDYVNLQNFHSFFLAVLLSRIVTGRLQNKKSDRVSVSVADPGRLSGIRIFSIPDPGSEFFPSRIPDPNFFHPGSASKNLSILTQKKLFLSSRNYDPGRSFRIQIFYPSRIPDLGV
jgi:hypothetical protein